MTKISKAAVVGAGNMGSGIVQKIATEGLPCFMLDLSQEALDRGMNTIKGLLSNAVERKIFSQQQVDEILSRITPTTNYADLKDCDVVVEAVFENLDVKKKVFQSLDEACDAKTILATNTSSFYVKDVAAATKRPDRCVGLHYFFHPAKNRLVEVIPGEATSEETRQIAWKFSEITGKTPIHSADAPGFVVNRFFVPWLNESVRLLEEGVADIATIEEASKQAFKIGMGPFELMNVTGVPISLHASTTLGQELGDFYAPCEALRHQVEDLKADWVLEGTPDESKFQSVADRLLGVVFQVACKLVDEKVARIEDVDIGARVGLRWVFGPFELMNRTGLAHSRELVQTICDRYSIEMPQTLAQQGDKPFAFELVRLSRDGDIATVTFDRPDAMNALNEEVVSQFRKAFDEANQDLSIKTIVLEGTGKAFVAGADIRFFIKNMKKGDLDAIVEFTRQGQELFKAIDNSEKFVIIKLDGLSLGGGSELVLTADAVVATSKGSLGFPETGIGIYPGLGGTQRLSRRVGNELAKWLVYSGDIIGADKALELGLVQKVCDTSELDAAIKEMSANPDQYRAAKPAEVGARFKALSELFASHSADDFLKGEVKVDDEKLAKIVKRVSFKAPIALNLSERLIDEGSKKSLDEGLNMELSELKTIFSTKDALEGLTSLGRKRPEWVGN